jgi:hypothetical protein
MSTRTLCFPTPSCLYVVLSEMAGMTAPVLGSGSDPTWMARVPKPSSASLSRFFGPSSWVGRLTGDPRAIGDMMILCGDLGGVELLEGISSWLNPFYICRCWLTLLTEEMKARKDDAFAFHTADRSARDRMSRCGSPAQLTQADTPSLILLLCCAVLGFPHCRMTHTRNNLLLLLKTLNGLSRSAFLALYRC